MPFHGNVALALPHLVAGILGLSAGVIALSARKGGRLHRRSGLIFVYAMLLLSLSGIAMATISLQKLNLLGGLLTFYLVTTALRTVRRSDHGFRWMDMALLILALAVGTLGYSFGLEAANSASGRIDGLPPAPAFMFGTVALLAAAGDLRMIVRGIDATRRVPRHLWRMCFALFSATGSFFPAQLPKFVPALRGSAMLWLPPLLVLVLMMFWLWRTRRSDALRPISAA